MCVCFFFIISCVVIFCNIFSTVLFVQYCYYNQMLDIFSDTKSDEIKNSESTTHIRQNDTSNQQTLGHTIRNLISSHAIIYIRFPLQMFVCVWYSLRVANLARIQSNRQAQWNGLARAKARRQQQNGKHLYFIFVRMMKSKSIKYYTCCATKPLNGINCTI